MKIRYMTLTFPGDERVMEKIKNDDLCKIITEKIMPMPKEGIIMVLLEYEDYNEGH